MSLEFSHFEKLRADKKLPHASQWWLVCRRAVRHMMATMHDRCFTTSQISSVLIMIILDWGQVYPYRTFPTFERIKGQGRFIPQSFTNFSKRGVIIRRMFCWSCSLGARFSSKYNKKTESQHLDNSQLSKLTYLWTSGWQRVATVFRSKVSMATNGPAGIHNINDFPAHFMDKWGQKR